MAKIILNSTSVHYPMFEPKDRSLKKSLFGVFKSQLGRSSKLTVKESLTNINLELNEGDKVGIIGHNGAGKSTLLKLIAGIIEPSAGVIKTDGSVSSMLGLMLGLDAELSGLENIYLKGALNNKTANEMNALREEIIAFSELGDAIYYPMNTYSSGMMMRLAFATATSFKSEIFLLDEWLSVGDYSFVKKANARLSELCHDASILVMASHDMNSVRELCNKCILLQSGQIAAFGAVEEVINMAENNDGS